uniref:transmembrane protein 53-like n=1 Tax=Styela clava TaxID=7725 RepID=UPI001939DA5F|nr:transmembrane protein 53-like [Styela clava]
MSAMSGRRLLDDQDELEYNITFPTCTVMDDSDAKEPVVYLLGWAGASDKHLAKYSAIYEQEGYVTLRYIAPEDVIFLLSKDTINTAKDTSNKLVQLLDDYDLRENPVLIHCFSNGGAVVYKWLAEAFLEQNVNIVGVIIDSGPAKLTFLNLLMAIYFSQRPKGMTRILHYIYRFLATNLADYLTFSMDERLYFYEQLLSSKTFLWPHLYLYSTNDGVMPKAEILEMVESRKAAGCSIVRCHDFVTSPHVSHLKFHKEDYINLCLQFLEDSLKIFDGEDIDGITGTNRHQTSSVDPPTKSRPYSEGSPSTSQRKSSLRLRRTSQSDSKL